MFLPASAFAQKTFVSVAFHDVYDSEDQLDEDAVTTDRLINFFEFLLADGWTALTLDDIELARQGRKVLPPKSILITFDDGYESLYSRVFPLVKAYRFPIVSALVGEWMDAPMSAQVNYGGEMVSRRDFLTWDQAREMQASGLVEFASHSYAQHISLQADVHGTLTPAMATYAFDNQANQYEDITRFEARIRRDMNANNRLFLRELGKRPRAFVWPYGRYSLQTIDIARQEGFRFALNLNDEPSTADLPMEIARYLPERNPTLQTMLTDLRHEPGLPAAARIMAFDVGQLWSPDQAQFDRQLGALIENVRVVSPTAVAFKPYVFEAGRDFKSWFSVNPTAAQQNLPGNRVAWQLSSRAGVGVYAQVSLAELLQALGNPENVLAWFDALGRQVPVTGLVFEDADDWLASLDVPGVVVNGSWDIRQARRSLSLDGLPAMAQLAMQAFRRVERYRPTVDLVGMVTSKDIPSNTTSWPRAASTVDYVLVHPGADWAGGLPPWRWDGGVHCLSQMRRVGLWMGHVRSPSQATALGQRAMRFMVSGGSVMGWRVSINDQLANVMKELEPRLSVATFPVKF
jgi:peptidoglycan/xylan/chitin deacetylase (PgdA/CDA1 family)